MKKKRKNNKIHRAITHIKLDFANVGKLNRLDDLKKAFMPLVQDYVDHIFDNNLKEVSKFDSLMKFQKSKQIYQNDTSAVPGNRLLESCNPFSQMNGKTNRS
ncbi:MAG: hypothetical protein JRG68_08000 [Deltaproteobacteria bacterium]|nr:hypothetical protein [Deltaproteobacteria bacterium]